MKVSFFILLLLIGHLTSTEAQSISGTGEVFEVTLASNGYTYPETQDWRRNRITRQGLKNWIDVSAYTQTFFFPQNSGEIEVSLKLKPSTGDSRLAVQCDGTGKAVDVDVKKNNEYIIVPAGKFFVTGGSYHFIRINGVSKSGSNFPDIESLILSGPAATSLKYNLSQYRSAPSTHLWYEYPKDSTVAWFYNEVTVPVGVNSTNAYYMTNGFSGGYSGIQLNTASERRFIFSVWSNYNTDNPKEIPADYAVTLIKKGKDVFTGEFGNEGSGGHSHLVFPWKQGVTYNILIGARASGDHTIYSCYYFTPEDGKWNLMAVWDKTKTGGKLFSGLYSFVENFGSNGNDFFQADYGNPWVCTPSGTWIEITKCRLTTTASPDKHQRYDYGGGVENDQFYMFTGGFKRVNQLKAGSDIERKPTHKVPHIDFSTLPIQ